MAIWINRKLEVFGDIFCQCSECGWENWQPPHWWSDSAKFCPQCGSKMEGIGTEDEEEGE